MNSIIRRGTAVGLTVAACALIAGCDDSYLDQSSARSQQPISSATLAEMEKLDTTPSSPTVIRTYKKEAELEIWKNEVERRIRAAQDLSDVPMVGTTRPEEARRRHAGAGRLLLDRAGADEPQLPLLSGVQRRVPERIRPGLWAHRRQCDGARSLFVRRLLLDDRRAGRRHLCDRPRIRSQAANARSSSSPIRST